jgi:hypothetical protein
MKINEIEMAELNGVLAPMTMWAALSPHSYTYTNSLALNTYMNYGEGIGALLERAKDQLPAEATGEQIVRRAIALKAKDAGVAAINNLATALRNGHMSHSHRHAVEIGDSLRTVLAQLAA